RVCPRPHPAGSVCVVGTGSGRRRVRSTRPTRRRSRHAAASMEEETESHAEKTVDTPPAPRAQRPSGLAAAPVERVVATRAPGARGGRMAGGRAAPHAVGHCPGSASDGPAVVCGPDLVHATGALLGTPGAVLARAGAHGRGSLGGY